MQTYCHPTGAEGRSDVKATCVGIDVQDFTRKVEARDQFAFQGLGIDFLETDTTFRYKGLGQGHLASHRDFERFDRLDKLLTFLFS